MDKAALELKRISQDNKIPVIAVSSFNHENYDGPVRMSTFKEGGAIEYSNDILIGLQFTGMGEKGTFDLNMAKQKHPRDIELKILKNRNGASGIIIPFRYY